MAISLPNGFIVTVAEPIDNRLILTKEEMLNIKKARMPEKYMCICKDDGKFYIYDSSIEPDPVYGRFKPYEEVIDLPNAITKAMGTETGKQAIEGAISKTLPGAIEDSLSTPEKSEKFATALSNVFESDHFEKTLDNKIDLSINLIQAIDTN